MKYAILPDQAAWDAKHTEVKTLLGIPNEHAKEYAKVTTVTNPESPLYESYLFPVIESGIGDCSEAFDGVELHTWNGSWFKTPE